MTHEEFDALLERVKVLGEAAPSRNRDAPKTLDFKVDGGAYQIAETKEALKRFGAGLLREKGAFVTSRRNGNGHNGNGRAKTKRTPRGCLSEKKALALMGKLYASTRQSAYDTRSLAVPLIRDKAGSPFWGTSALLLRGESSLPRPIFHWNRNFTIDEMMPSPSFEDVDSRGRLTGYGGEASYPGEPDYHKIDLVPETPIPEMLKMIGGLRGRDNGFVAKLENGRGEQRDVEALFFAIVQGLFPGAIPCFANSAGPTVFFRLSGATVALVAAYRPTPEKMPEVAEVAAD